ncbi:MAG TPA: UDP-N-acetylmuramoyl-tripeptide--D-alanyl-D-alanine ligase [Blastocatellia bacterium]|nr:UDP-N-acetylmuramoyl-tripeptide--D-alanyl-D-alanine ligase [Blastocatellia bacterium]
MQLGEIARIIGADWKSEALGAVEPIGYSIDSRTIKPGELFFAIRGENVDGNKFVGDALGKRACAAVIAQDATEVPVDVDDNRLLRVSDTLVALQQLAHKVLQDWNRPLVAITGSAGKTTTKDLTALLLSAQYSVLKTAGNLNNAYGLPLSILKLVSDGHKATDFDLIVLEMGMNHAGEIRDLCKIAPPTVGVVTIVAPVHLEFFDSIDGIADAKAELIESLGPTGLAVLNADDPRVIRMRERHSGPVRTYGIENQADVIATEIEPVGLSQISFRLRTPSGNARVVMPLIGRHNLYNALAAAAVADHFNVTPGAIADVLGKAEPSKMRGQVLRFADGFTVIDDSYNSNPRALNEMLKSVGHMPDFKRRIAVLGEMLELGPAGPEMHRDSGHRVVAEGMDIVIGVRGLAKQIVEGAIEQGLPAEQAHFCEDSETAAKLVLDTIREGDIVLVKGSRGVKTDVVVSRLKEKFSLVDEVE